MRLWITALLLTLTACSGGRPLGCAKFDDAAATWAQLGNGLQAGTVTPQDAAEQLGEIASDLQDVQHGGDAVLQADAKAAADAAGRLRVALLQGGKAGSDAAVLRQHLDAMVDDCS